MAGADPSCSDGLQAAAGPLLRTFSRTGGRRNADFRTKRWGPENIPAFLPENWLARHFTQADGVSTTFTRRAASLQMVAGGSLGEAARFLGIGSADVAWPGSGAYGATGRVRTGAGQQAGPLGFDAALEAPGTAAARPRGPQAPGRLRLRLDPGHLRRAHFRPPSHRGRPAPRPLVSPEPVDRRLEDAGPQPPRNPLPQPESRARNPRDLTRPNHRHQSLLKT